MAAGFPPIARRDARVLILGSMPSIASLDKSEYYGHPRNAFWPIVCELFGSEFVESYAKRKKLIKENGIAVWDVMAACERNGSLDSAIKESSIVANDFADFFSSHRELEHVFFNGSKAEQSFRRYVLETLEASYPRVQYTRLPSTSPAMAKLDFQSKLKAWRVVASV